MKASTELLDAVDLIDSTKSLCRVLDMALANDASENEGPLRELLHEIHNRVIRAGNIIDLVRKEMRGVAGADHLELRDGGLP